MTAWQWIRFGVELLIDLATGKLERQPAPTPNRGLTHRDAEIQAKASREAGPAAGRPFVCRRCGSLHRTAGELADHPCVR